MGMGTIPRGLPWALQPRRIDAVVHIEKATMEHGTRPGVPYDLATIASRADMDDCHTADAGLYILIAMPKGNRNVVVTSSVRAGVDATRRARGGDRR